MLLLSTLVVASVLQGPQAADPPVYHGRSGATDVRAPKLAGQVVVDGRLDEPMWREAARLTGFSQYTPVDGIAADDSTDVLVWYSASALHVGIRAYAPSGSIRSTLAQRDRIFGDDNVQLFLSTFNDGRQATFLAVNPLGVQADGAINENGGGCGGFRCAVAGRERPDLSQDFVWQSAGLLTDFGYEAEIVVPLKSIRFQAGERQTWGINVLRVVQRSGQEQSWTPARLARSSFLQQSGRLLDLERLRAGRAIDVVPTMTSSVAGTGSGSAGAWEYAGGNPEFGGHVRWGVTPNLTLNATANPDFSQVEADEGQFSFDPRQAVFFGERRPFFLDGNEQFQVPNNLIYTRRIVQPAFATKLTGRAFGTQVGMLAALDDRISSRYDDHPVFGILRLTRDLRPGTQVGITHTERHDGEDVNRVTGVDGRVVLGDVHSFTFSGAIARDRVADVTTTAALWNLGYRLNGRAFRTRYSVSGIDDDFRTRSGFISRPGVGRANLAHSYTWLRPERRLEALTGEVVLDGTWHYDSLVGGGGIQDRKLHFNLNSTWKGGWNAGASVLVEDFGYDPEIYADYALLRPDGSLAPFAGTPRLPNLDYLISVNSPTFDFGSFNLFTLWGRDENFPEWATGDIRWMTASLTLTPTERLRAGFSYNLTRVSRPNDGSRVLLSQIPRIRLEYQVSRALQVRLVTEYQVEDQDDLRDNSRTELPIVFLDGAGGHRPATGYRDSRLRADLLLSYFPNPGTVVYLGYGSNHRNAADDVLSRRRLQRTNDAFFLKLSYLFRMQG